MALLPENNRAHRRHQEPRPHRLDFFFDRGFRGKISTAFAAVGVSMRISVGAADALLRDDFALLLAGDLRVGRIVFLQAVATVRTDRSHGRLPSELCDYF